MISNSERKNSEDFLNFLWSLAIMNEFIYFIRLFLFCMFFITLFYAINTFSLLLN